MVNCIGFVSGEFDKFVHSIQSWQYTIYRVIVYHTYCSLLMSCLINILIMHTVEVYHIQGSELAVTITNGSAYSFCQCPLINKIIVEFHYYNK